MKDQITSDLLASAGKLAPSAAGAVAAQAGVLSPQSILLWLTILYTLAMLLNTCVRNWGMWVEWWGARFTQAKRLWAWMRRK